MKFSGNAHNTMPYMQVTFLRRSFNSGARGMRIRYKLASIYKELLNKGLARTRHIGHLFSTNLDEIFRKI